MLPEHRYPADESWISEKLNEICALANFGYAQRVMERYSEAYQEAHEQEPVSYRKAGTARYTANSRLRGLIQSLMAKTVAPPKI